MFKLICKTCKEEFESKSSTKKYCTRECWNNRDRKYSNRNCLQCGKEFYPETSTQKYCSHKCLGLAQRNRDETICSMCGKSFYSRNNKNQKYCSKECYTKSQITVKEKECKWCGKTFRGRNDESKFCSKKCLNGYFHNEPIEEKTKRMKLLWESNKNIVSKINLQYKGYLEDLGHTVGLEFQIEDRFYDLKVGDTLIEINPYPFHNSTWAPAANPGCKPKDSNYHYDKLKKARDNGYRCIMVWDWDNFNKIAYLLDDNKRKIYARNCKIKQIEYNDCHQFFEDYHLQGDTKKDKNNIYIGLYYNNELVECMSFGKPRYNKNYEWEILRLCSHKDYKVVGGANKIFKHFLEKTDANSIISYCDMSKFDGKVYEQLGFKLKKWNKPSKHWYNIKQSKSKQHITDNLLRQYGYDWIFNTSFGKGTNNDELMRQNGYVEIYDCGQATFVWTRE